MNANEKLTNTMVPMAFKVSNIVTRQKKYSHSSECRVVGGYSLYENPIDLTIFS